MTLIFSKFKAFLMLYHAKGMNIYAVIDFAFNFKISQSASGIKIFDEVDSRGSFVIAAVTDYT